MKFLNQNRKYFLASGILIIIVVLVTFESSHSRMETHIKALYSRLSSGDVSSVQCSQMATMQEEQIKKDNDNSEFLFLNSNSPFHTQKTFDYVYSYRLKRCIGMLHKEDWARPAGASIANMTMTDNEDTISDLATNETIADCARNYVNNKITCSDIVSHDTTYTVGNMQIPVMYPIYSGTWGRFKSLLSD